MEQENQRLQKYLVNHADTIKVFTTIMLGMADNNLQLKAEIIGLNKRELWDRIFGLLHILDANQAMRTAVFARFNEIDVPFGRPRQETKVDYERQKAQEEAERQRPQQPQLSSQGIQRLAQLDLIGEAFIDHTEWFEKHMFPFFRNYAKDNSSLRSVLNPIMKPTNDLSKCVADLKVKLISDHPFLEATWQHLNGQMKDHPHVI